MKAIGHHTVEDLGNAEYVEKHAPFLSEGNAAFLGPGYYFWENDLDLAHWWGKLRYGDDYMICEAIIECDNETYLDLAGNKDDMRMVLQLRERFEPEIKRKFSIDEVSLNRLIEHCQHVHQHTLAKVFPFKVIRSVDNSPTVNEKKRRSLIKFTQQKSNFTDLDPRIIICVLEKQYVLPQGIKIVHPKQYLL